MHEKAIQVSLTALLILSSSAFATASEPKNPDCTITGDQTIETLFGSVKSLKKLITSRLDLYL